MRGSARSRDTLLTNSSGVEKSELEGSYARSRVATGSRNRIILLSCPLRKVNRKKKDTTHESSR